jgi:hypothetical protein
VFFNANGEIVQAVHPRPNRAVLFDSRIIHAGRAPSRSCTTLRVRVAYKLERVRAGGGFASRMQAQPATENGALKNPLNRALPPRTGACVSW